MAMALKIIPDEDVINFPAGTTPNKEPQAQFMIENPTENPMVFRIKATHPGKFRVVPNVGLLQGKKKAQISIHVTDRLYPDKEKYRFQLNAIYAPASMTRDKAVDIWKDPEYSAWYMVMERTFEADVGPFMETLSKSRSASRH